MSICAVKSCPNKWKKTGNTTTYYKFPDATKEPLLFEAWAKYSGVPCAPHNTLRICSDHFTPDAYSLKSRLLPGAQKRLKEGAIPGLEIPANISTASAPEMLASRKRSLSIESFDPECIWIPTAPPDENFLPE